MDENTLSPVNSAATPARSTSRLSKALRSFGFTTKPQRALAREDADSIRSTQMQVEIARADISARSVMR